MDYNKLFKNSNNIFVDTYFYTIIWQHMKITQKFFFFAWNTPS